MTPRKRGRPALSPHTPSADVCVKMSGELYDRAYAEASRQRTSVPEVIRRAIDRALPRPDEFSNPK